MSFDTDQEVGSRGPPPKACSPPPPASSGPAPEAYLGVHHMHLNGPVTYISYGYSIVTDILCVESTHICIYAHSNERVSIKGHRQ